MKRVVLIIISVWICAMVFWSATSCSKEYDDYSSPTPFRGGISGIIEGEYAEWDSVGISFGNGIVVSTPIIDGKFTFSVLPTPNPEDLYLIIESEEMPKNVNCSNKDAQQCGMSFVALKYNGLSYTWIGIGQKSVASNSVTMVMYVYADRNVKIKGSYSGSENGYNFNSEVNINLIQGFNTLLYTTNGSENDGLTVTYKNGAPPLDAVWTGLY